MLANASCLTKSGSLIMKIVAALGGNALLKRGQPMTAETQRGNVRVAAQALAPVAAGHDLIVTHGNGPQVGLLALQGAAYQATQAYPLDILDAETEGQIGYLIEQELRNAFTSDKPCATLLTQIEVDADDPAFRSPTKPIGPVYTEKDARRLETERGWDFARDGDAFRRVVASPEPQRIVALDVIELLVENGVLVVCAGGGGIPAVRRNGGLIGVEAVIDKDSTSALLAIQLKANALLMLTDVDGVYLDWNTPSARRIRRMSPAAIRQHRFAEGSMGPKVEASCRFAEATGGIAGIGALKDTSAILAGEAGTVIAEDAAETVYWD
jgi:carbamate kinase